MPSSTVWVWEGVKRIFRQCKRVFLAARFQLPVNCTQYLAKDQSKETASPWTLRPGIESLYHLVMRRQIGVVGDREWSSQTPYILVHPVQTPAVGLLPSSGKHCSPLCEEGGSRSSIQSSESYEYQLKQSSGSQIQRETSTLLQHEGNICWVIT